MNSVYKMLALLNDARALSRGPAVFVRRVVRKTAHKALAGALRDVGLTEHRRRR